MKCLLCIERIKNKFTQTNVTSCVMGIVETFPTKCGNYIGFGMVYQFVPEEEKSIVVLRAAILFPNNVLLKFVWYF